jgi:hypothetical protein
MNGSKRRGKPAPETWQGNWQGMPEFIQRDLSPKRTIKVHFNSEKHVERFAELIGQDIYDSQKFVWFPKARIGRTDGKRYASAA